MSIRIADTQIPHVYAPRNYPCHVCAAQPGHNCVLPNGAKREWSHNGRGPRNVPKEEDNA